MVPSSNRESSTPYSGAWHSLQGRTCLAQRLPSGNQTWQWEIPYIVEVLRGKSSINVYKWWIFHYRRLKHHHLTSEGRAGDRQAAIASIQLHLARVPAGPKKTMWMELHPCPGRWLKPKKPGLGMTFTVCELEHHHRNVVNFPINSMVIVQFVM